MSNIKTQKIQEVLIRRFVEKWSEFWFDFAANLIEQIVDSVKAFPGDVQVAFIECGSKGNSAGKLGI